MESTFFGKDGFIWWKGVVENRKDPLFLGRVKVRIFGWHTEDVLEMPTENLPWATPSLPIDNGRNPVGLKEGDWCWGFFLDGAEGQKPVVVGFIPGIDSEPANPQRGYCDQTPDDQLVAGVVPRPPEMVPPTPAEENLGGDEEAPKTGGRFGNPNQLPGVGIAFGELAANFDPANYKYDLNRDGVFDQQDAAAIIDIQENGGNIDSIATPSAPISRYPLETRLNEPMTSRLARNEKIEESPIATKLGELASGEIAGFDGTGMGGDSAVETDGFLEPKSPYAAQYPYNHVYESESGHVIEIDDTPGAERLHWFHRSGTFREVHPDGKQVNKVKNDEYNFIYGSYFNSTEKTINFHALDSFKVKAGAGAIINATGDVSNQAGANANVLAKKHANLRAGENINIGAGGDMYIWVEGGKLHIKATTEVLIQAAGGKVQLVSPDSIDLIGQKITLNGEIHLNGDVKGPIPTGTGTPATPLVNSADDEVEDSPTDASPKEGFLLPNGTPQDVWKPESDSNGKLVTLSALSGVHTICRAVPTGQLEAVKIKYQHADGTVTEWEVVRPALAPGEVLATGEYKGMFEDGVRHMYRWPKTGKKYPSPCFWVIGGNKQLLILDSGLRNQCFPPAPFNDKVPLNLNRKP
jgi:hypothetical protein